MPAVQPLGERLGSHRHPRAGARDHGRVRRRYEPDQVMAFVLFVLCVVLVLVLLNG
jgi:hypothetical protein